MESCVNSVGVELNMASSSLLTHVAGIGPKLAERIVEHRDATGPFPCRKRLLDVPKLGRKVFEQAAGFLRIRDGQDPLDNSAVHPESYRVVEKMAAKLGVATSQLMGNATLAAKLDAQETSSTRRAACRRSRTSWPSWPSRAAIRAASSRWPGLPRASTIWKT